MRNEKSKGWGAGMKRALSRVKMLLAEKPTTKNYNYPIQAPKLLPGIVPTGEKAPVLAMDYSGATGSYYADLVSTAIGAGFPGFQYLSMLATRAEYRAFASSLSTEMTREWIEFTSKQDDDTNTADKIKLIEAEFIRLGVRGVFQKAIEHDANFGRAQIFINIKGADRSTPLILSPKTIKKGTLESICTIEAIWTTPSVFNALDPAAPDFYKPSSWYMIGQKVHSSRLLTIVTRPLPDILKPAFNFAGMSLFQLAEPYVDNWLRTRQSVSDLINNFSITCLATAMDQVLQGDDDGSDVNDRADLFTLTRSNRGMMLIDKEREELVKLDTSLAGLSELQAQSQEHMCSVSRTPAIVLTGISPTGLNASSEGEVRVYYDWIIAQADSFWREPLDVVLKVLQLHLFGEIDPDIGFNFVPLYQMTDKELSEIRKSDAEASQTYVTMGAVSPQEVRVKLAQDPESGYQGLDTTIEIEPPADPSQEEEPDGMGDDDKDDA